MNKQHVFLIGFDRRQWKRISASDARALRIGIRPLGALARLGYVAALVLAIIVPIVGGL